MLLVILSLNIRRQYATLLPIKTTASIAQMKLILTKVNSDHILYCVSGLRTEFYRIYKFCGIRIQKNNGSSWLFTIFNDKIDF